MVHPILDLQDVERFFSLQAKYGQSLAALSDVVNRMVELGGVDAVAALPDAERERLLRAAVAATSEAQRQSDASLLHLKEMMTKAGLAEAL